MEKQNEKKKVVLYYRVGTKKNEDIGLDSQRDTLRGYAAEKGYTIVGEIGEVAKGSTLRRAGIRRVYQLGRKGKMDKVLVCSSSRIARPLCLLIAFCDRLSRYGIEAESPGEGSLDKVCKKWKKIREKFPFFGE